MHSAATQNSNSYRDWNLLQIDLLTAWSNPSISSSFSLSEHTAIHNINILTLCGKDARERLWWERLICRSASSFILGHRYANYFLPADLIATLCQEQTHTIYIHFCDTHVTLSFLLVPALSQDQLSQRQWTYCCFKKCEHFSDQSVKKKSCRIHKAHPAQGYWKYWHSKMPAGNFIITL